jgi:hypothetical protein
MSLVRTCASYSLENFRLVANFVKLIMILDLETFDIFFVNKSSLTFSNTISNSERSYSWMTLENAFFMKLFENFPAVLSSSVYIKMPTVFIKILAKIQPIIPSFDSLILAWSIKRWNDIPWRIYCIVQRQGCIPHEKCAIWHFRSLTNIGGILRESHQRIERWMKFMSHLTIKLLKIIFCLLTFITTQAWSVVLTSY